MKFVIIGISFLIILYKGYAQEISDSILKKTGQNPFEIVYKQIDTVILKMTVYNPPKIKTTKNYPAIVLKRLEEEGEDLNISSKPNVQVLFNPVLDNGPDGYGYDRIGEQYPEISPFHNLRKSSPPTILFLGTADKLVPVSTIKKYREKMECIGSRCDWDTSRTNLLLT